MPSLTHLIMARDAKTGDSALTPTMVNLLIALLVLFACISLLIGTLLILRHMRRQQALRYQKANEDLPMYCEKDHISARSSRITVVTKDRGSVYEKECLMGESSRSGSEGSVPEIRITFPEEFDEQGKRTSGRVVVVKVGEHSVGLEPVQEREQLPAYEQKAGGAKDEGRGYESLDLDRMGGLKEKDMRP